MKKVILGLLLCLTGNLLAQTNPSANRNPYDRSSMTFIDVNYLLDRYQPQVNQYLSTFDFGGKYNINTIGGITSYLYQGDRSVIVDKSMMILNAMNSPEHNVARKIWDFWFQRKEDGACDPSLIIERGHYNIKPEEMEQIKASKNGMGALNSIAFEYTKKTYVVVVDITNINPYISDNGVMHITGSVSCYLYRIKDVQSMLDNIDKWYFTKNDVSDANLKKDYYDNMKLEMEYVLTSNAGVGPDPYLAMVDGFAVAGNAFSAGANSQKATKRAYTGDGKAEFISFMSRAMDEAINSLEKAHPDFIVYTPVTKSNSNTLEAKIGLKEGLKKGDGYKVLVSVEDKNGEKEYKEVGFARATKVANNKLSVNQSSQDTSSVFILEYKKSRIEKGFALRQSKDKKIRISMGLQAPFGVLFDFEKVAFNSYGFTGALSFGLLMQKIDASTENRRTEYVPYYGYQTITDRFDGKTDNYCLTLGWSFGYNLFHPNLKIDAFLKGGFGVGSTVIDHVNGVDFTGTYPAIKETGLSVGYNYGARLRYDYLMSTRNSNRYFVYLGYSLNNSVSRVESKNAIGKNGSWMFGWGLSF